MESAFCDYGDGLKNYYTLQSYIQQPVGEEGLYHFNSLNYPYGEYVYSGDNTPSFSIPFRWFCSHIKDISSYAIPLYNLWLIIGFFLSSILCFYIFKKITRNDVWSLMAAVFLPWTNMQTMRLWCGHFNLSFSWIILAVIALMIVWMMDSELKKRRQILLGFFLKPLDSVGSFVFYRWEWNNSQPKD